VPTTAKRNALDVTLTNIGEATVWGTRAKLSGAEPLEITITSDGDATVRIMLPFAPGTTVTPLNATAGSATWTIDAQSVVLHVGAGINRFSM
jgi:hypothetical protein